MLSDDAELLSGAHEFVVDAGNNARLDTLIGTQLGISRTRAATLIAIAAVTVDGSLERASFRAQTGARVKVVIAPSERREVSAEDLPVNIVYEDESIVVVNKAAGMVVHPAPGNWSGTLVNALKGRVRNLSHAGGEDRAGLVHRLDKDTSGLLIVAKTERAHRILSAAIAARRVARRYAALCWGHLNSDELFVDQPIGRDPRDRKRMAIVKSGRAARTDFFRIARLDSADLLRAHLRSGRTHQIRVHLASIGHPVVGDDVYGGGGGRRLAALPPRRHFLHAAWLQFKHPVTGEALDFRAPLPVDLTSSLRHMAGMGAADGEGKLDIGEERVEGRLGRGGASQNLDILEHFGFYRTNG